jgi:hypothetical protein
MSEVSDLVMPLLQKIHSELANVKEEVRDLNVRVGRIEERLITHEGWTYHAIGLGTVAKAEAESAAANYRLLAKKLDANDH